MNSSPNEDPTHKHILICINKYYLFYIIELAIYYIIYIMELYIYYIFAREKRNKYI